LVETRKYAFHRKIERNRTAAKQAKKFHGTICQACDLVAKQYGAIGKGFIEAHHLKAISTLAEGIAVHYDIAEDFAVLCSAPIRTTWRRFGPWFSQTRLKTARL
jgi:5-methylcytosine-specific restriction enzyme A